MDAENLRELTAKIVSAYVSKNTVLVATIPQLIASIHVALQNAGQPAAPAETARVPAVPVKKSVTPDAIVCLECGKRGRLLKRHLDVEHGLNPDAYRKRWNLPPDYPLVAPNYTVRRSELAKEIGLGKDGGALQRVRSARR